ncbi:MAG: zinc-binding dehydrogenase [Chloroflexi bacterium]|nr:MAG: zinc-binding dehydrogenase [Chloroflexota bacterium]
MKAIVFAAQHQVTLSDVARPEPGAGEVLVRSRAIGICHSDFEVLDGRYILPVSFPLIPGHEWAGEVAEVGAGVTGVRPGDRVVGECAVAADHHFGLTSDGAAAEYFRVRPEWLHLLPDELSWSQGALVEPFSVAYHATRAAGGVDASDTAVVLGAGPIGLCCVAATVALGARTIVVDPIAHRRDVAATLGAEAAVDPGAGDVVELVRQLTGGGGADIVLEASGSPTAMANALDVAAYQGRVVFIGINVGATAPAPMGLIQSRALSVRGIIGSPDVWPATLRFLARSGLDLTPIVTVTYPLESGPDAFAAARRTDEQIKVHILHG